MFPKAYLVKQKKPQKIGPCVAERSQTCRFMGNFATVCYIIYLRNLQCSPISLITEKS